MSDTDNNVIRPDSWNSPTNKQLYKHKGRGKSPEISQKRNRNKPPDGEPFIWQTQEMLGCSAWRALPAPSRVILDRIMLEHMQHAGMENGKLPVTYDDFENYGVRRHAIRFAILSAVALGFVVVTEEGHASAGDTRRAARYALTWLDRWDGAPRTNEWKRFESMSDANRAVAEVKAKLIAEAVNRSGLKDKLKKAAA